MHKSRVQLIENFLSAAKEVDWQSIQSRTLDGLPIYLFGGTEEVLDQLNARLMQRYPDLKIAGSYAPPFRPL
ncbi:MAG: WecB/TagA/CpsF family glycosyltransferase, partial [Planctomycetota bacterium]